MESNATAAPMIDWRAILQREIKAAGKRGKTLVAERMGVKRCYVSRVMSEGKSAYAEVPAAFIRRVLDLESDVDCPPVGARVARTECRKANQPAPTHNPLAMRIWRECQRCPLKPLEGTP
jgi:hypothetical protein